MAATVCAAALLRETALPALEARILLGHALGWRRTELITRAEQALTPEQAAAFHALEQRRVAGEPVAHLVGQREFYGLALQVSDAVLIPRPETELLVDLALAALTGQHAPRVLDLGTGSGAIALAIADARPDARLTAVDRSRAALAIAARNAQGLLPGGRPGGPVRLLAGDWFEPLRGKGAALADGDDAWRIEEPDRIAGGICSEIGTGLGSGIGTGIDNRIGSGAGRRAISDLPCFDMIVSNPPYIPAGDIHLRSGDLRFEPQDALTDGADGLSAIRTIVAGAPSFLVPGGHLLIEHGFDQGAAVRALLHERGFTHVASACDLAGHERIGHAVWPAV